MTSKERMRLLLLLASLGAVVGGDLFHYYKLKKFVTAVAFARALGRRPTILPVPIPIPIPIGQNEVIRIPASSAKTFVSLTGGQKYSGKRGGGKFTGSSDFGYALPGTFDLSHSLGGGGSNIMVLDGSNGLYDAGSEFASSSPNIIRMVSGSPRGLFLGNKPRRYIMRGRSTRDFDNMEIVMRPVRPRYQPQGQQYIGKKRGSTSSGKKKKPIPVGEKFTLP